MKFFEIKDANTYLHGKLTDWIVKQTEETEFPKHIAMSTEHFSHFVQESKRTEKLLGMPNTDSRDMYFMGARIYGVDGIEGFHKMTVDSGD